MSKSAALPTPAFFGYITEANGRIVQEWYDSLCQSDRDEIVDTINYLLSMPVTDWRRPEFDKVTPPLVEIRCRASQANHTIRIYGAFDDIVRGRIILLNGTEAKKKSRDAAGQDLALTRLKLLRARKGKADEFRFEKEPAGESPSEPGVKAQDGVIQFRQRDCLSNPGDKKR